MHAVVYEVDMKKDWEGDADAELDMIVQASRDFPGFVRGLWLSDGTTGLAIEVLESEEAAREVAANASIPPEASVSLRSAKAYEVVREA